MKRLNGLCTNQNQFKCMIEVDNMYDEVTIETVSHWALQKICVQPTHMQYLISQTIKTFSFFP